MTHPTTEPNIRERLARAACFRGLECEASGPTGCKSAEQCFLWDDEPLKVVDAILAELQEPSEGMALAGLMVLAEQMNDLRRFYESKGVSVPAEDGSPILVMPCVSVGACDSEQIRAIHNAMVQHIRDGGQ